MPRLRRGEITAGPRRPPSGAAEYFRKLAAVFSMRDLTLGPDREDPLAQPHLSERNLTYCAGMTLQFVRPDIRQSCILLAAVRS
jgi:hypothetical protein